MAGIRRRAYFIDAGYTVKDGKTYVSLILKGKRTVKLFYQYDPYFIVDAPPERMDDILKVRGAMKSGEIVSPLRAEPVERKAGFATKRMIKLYCREPSHVPAIRSAVPFPTYEANI